MASTKGTGASVGDNAANSELEAPERSVDARLCIAVVNFEALVGPKLDGETVAAGIDDGVATSGDGGSNGAWSCRRWPSFLPTESTRADSGCCSGIADTAANALRPGMEAGDGKFAPAVRGVGPVARPGCLCFSACASVVRTRWPALAFLSENDWARGGAELGVKGDRESVDSDGEDDSYGFRLIGRAGCNAPEIAIVWLLVMESTSDRLLFVVFAFRGTSTSETSSIISSDRSGALLILS